MPRALVVMPPSIPVCAADFPPRTPLRVIGERLRARGFVLAIEHGQLVAIRVH